MENNPNINQSEKKHNKVVSWFLGLPKWGKILLVAGSAAGVTTAITVPVVVLNANKGGISVAEQEFKNAMNALKSAAAGDEADNRNFTIKMEGNYTVHYDESTSYKVTMNTETKIKKNFLYQYGIVAPSGGAKETSTNKTQYLGDGIYYSITNSQEEGEDEETEVELQCFSSDYASWFGSAEYDFNNLKFSNGCYYGTFAITIEQEIYNLPASVYFGNDKNIKTIKVKETGLDFGKKYDVDLITNISNYGSTTNDLKEGDFPKYEYNCSESSPIVSQDLGNNFKLPKIIIVHTNLDYIKNKKLKLLSDDESFNGINEVCCNGDSILIDGESGKQTIDLSGKDDKLGKNIYIETDDDDDLLIADAFFSVTA